MTLEISFTIPFYILQQTRIGAFHSLRWQAEPSYPGKHVHSPVKRSHIPESLHSASVLCFEFFAGSFHDTPRGQVNWLQSAPATTKRLGTNICIIAITPRMQQKRV